MRAYQIAAASVSLALGFPFVQGMAYQDLLEVFKAARLLPDVAAGDTFTITEPALLMNGAVTAFVAEKKMTNLKRIGSMRAVLRRTSALPPTDTTQVGLATGARAAASETSVVAAGGAKGGDGDALQGALAAKATPFVSAMGGMMGGKDVEINAPALLEPGTYPVTMHSVVRAPMSTPCRRPCRPV